MEITIYEDGETALVDGQVRIRRYIQCQDCKAHLNNPGFVPLHQAEEIVQLMIHQGLHCPSCLSINLELVPGDQLYHAE